MIPAQNTFKVVSVNDGPMSLEDNARVYKAIKIQIEQLEEALKPYKQVLEAAAMEAPDMKLDLDGFKVTLVEVERENFSLKDAKVKLGMDLLKEFIKITNYTMLRVMEK